MIDKEGYRPNVGIVLLNKQGYVFWGKRIGKSSWQFPQGGIEHKESPLQAMFRELYEEVGLRPEHVKFIGRTRDWLRYEVPAVAQRGRYRGQKQIWFLVRLQADDRDIDLNATSHPEFDGWRWDTYGESLDTVIEFKREVYKKALIELSSFLPVGCAQKYALRSGLCLPHLIRKPSYIKKEANLFAQVDSEKQVNDKVDLSLFAKDE